MRKSALFSIVMSILMVVMLALACTKAKDADDYFAAGKQAFENKEYDKAIEHYQKALALEPNSFYGYNLLGMAYRFKFLASGVKHYRQKEVEAFKKAISLEPEYWVALINLGTTLYHSGSRKAGAVYLKKALEVNPNHPERQEIQRMIDTASQEDYFAKGIEAFHDQDYDKAIEHYLNGIEREPDSTEGYNLLGMAYRFKYNMSGNDEYRDKEIEAFRKAIELNPRNWMAHINLGMSLRLSGKVSKGNEHLKKALEINPDHPERDDILKMISKDD